MFAFITSAAKAACSAELVSAPLKRCATQRRFGCESGFQRANSVRGLGAEGRDTNPFPFTTYSSAADGSARKIGRAGKRK